MILEEKEDDNLIDIDELGLDEKEKSEYLKKQQEAEVDMATQIIKEARKHRSKSNNLKIAGVEILRDEERHESKSNHLDARTNSIIDKVGLYKNMTFTEIEDLKKKIIEEPTSVLEGLKNYFSQNIKPILERRESMLKQQVKERGGHDVSIFLYVSAIGRDEEDGSFKEQERFMSADLTKKPGFKIYNGQVVQQMKPEQTPFVSPTELFKEEVDLKNKQVLKP